MKRENPLLDKSLLFAARIIKLNKYLTKEKKETIIAKQIIRSATSTDYLCQSEYRVRNFYIFFNIYRHFQLICCIMLSWSHWTRHLIFTTKRRLLHLF